MKKYITKLVFRVVSASGDLEELDVQFRLVEAPDDLAAFYKARSLGLQEEDSSGSSEKFSWKFIDVADLYDLDRMRDGDQIFSETRKEEDVTSFVTYVKNKALTLQEQVMELV
jgi:hypothetical protein